MLFAQRVAGLSLHLAEFVDEHCEADMVKLTSANLSLAELFQLVGELATRDAVLEAVSDHDGVELVESLDGHDEALVLQVHLSCRHALHLDEELVLKPSHEVLENAFPAAPYLTNRHVHLVEYLSDGPREHHERRHVQSLQEELFVRHVGDDGPQLPHPVCVVLLSRPLLSLLQAIPEVPVFSQSIKKLDGIHNLLLVQLLALFVFEVDLEALDQGTIKILQSYIGALYVLLLTMVGEHARHLPLQ